MEINAGTIVGTLTNPNPINLYPNPNPYSKSVKRFI